MSRLGQENKPWWRESWPVALLALACVVAMGPVLANGFVSWDDYQTVARNRWFNPPSLGTLGHFWTTPHMDLYVPVTYTAWWLLAEVSYFFSPDSGAVSAGLFHGANLLTHIGATLVVYALLKRLAGPGAGAVIGALLFAVHPVQVETVAWASGLKDLLGALLMWGAVVVYLKVDRIGESATRRNGDTAKGRNGDAATRRWAGYGAATLLFVLAMLAKPTAMVTPALLVVIEVLVLRRPWRAWALPVGAWFLLAIPCAVLTSRVQPPTSAIYQPPLHLRPLIATDALAMYAGKLAWPIDLTIDPGRLPKLVLEKGWAYWTWVVPLILAAGFLLAYRRTRDPRVLAAPLLLLIPLSPVLGLVPFDFQQYSTVAEHYLYPAMPGLALLAAGWVGAMLKKRPAPAWVMPVTAGLLLAMAVRSHVQARVWKDNLSLFAHTVEVNPRSYAGHNSLASALMEAGQYGPAVDHANTAIELGPQNSHAYLTLGTIYIRQGKLDAAIETLNKAHALTPNDVLIHVNLASVYGQKGQTDSAMKHALRAIELDPDDAQARLNLGTLYAQLNRPDDALREISRAVELAPHSAIARTNLGFLLMGKGKFAEALTHFEAALKSNPNYPQAAEGRRIAMQQMVPR